MVHVHGLRPGRATYDIDFGIAVENWDHFARLKEHLIATGDFAADRRALQRLIYSDQGAGFSLPVDLIPFGGVASGDGTIEWPPSRDIVMNVAGFEEALTSSMPVEIAPGLVVRVASLTGLALLKLVAWSDRGRETDKDAVDLYRLVTSYANIVEHVRGPRMALIIDLGDGPAPGAKLARSEAPAARTGSAAR